MEPDELSENVANQPVPITASFPIDPAGGVLVAQGAGTCNSCSGSIESNSDVLGTNPYSYVYAVGQIEMRFPSLAVEKEFAQATGRAETTGLTDRGAMHNILTLRENRYLVRQLCWLLTIEGLETYILAPRDSLDYEQLIEAVRPTPRRTDVDVVIGVRGSIASPSMCNGLMVPIVTFDQIYSFDSDSFINEISGAIRAEPGVGEEAEGSKRRRRKNGNQEAGRNITATAEDLFNRIVQVSDNAGATDEHRALNYLATRYPEIYRLTSERFNEDFSLTEVSVQPSRLSSTRKIVTVIFTFSPRFGAATGVYGVEQYFVRVDVTEEFPFLVSPLQKGFIR